MFAKNARPRDINERDIFSEIETIEQEERERNADEAKIEKEEAINKLSPGASGLLLYFNAKILAQRNANLKAHLARVAELEKGNK